MKESDATSLLDVDLRVPPERVGGPLSSQWSGIILANQIYSWQLEALRDINALAELPANWNSYNSEPVTAEAVAGAVHQIVSLPIADLNKPHVVPVSGGGLQLVWRHGDKELDIEVLPDGTTEYLMSARGDCLHEGRITTTDSFMSPSLFNWLLAS